ncbi:MAG: hypothetical protein IJ389_04005 [Clostridia bacterium]|nr:hypothetical protein [Clostridia bacterium]
MKTNSILSLFLLLCIILCGCTHDSQLPADGTTDAITETDTASETAEPQESETYEITYRIEKVFEDFNYGKPVEVEGLAVTMMLPKHIKTDYPSEIQSLYRVYNEEMGKYIRGFEICRMGYVSNDFVLDENIYEVAYIYRLDSMYSKDRISSHKGTLSNGYEYVYFQIGDADRYRVRIFVRIQENYILEIDYADDSKNYHCIYDIIDSIKVK